MPNSMLLQVREVSKIVKSQTLLQPLSFSLQPGKVLALCGGNGAGKSTLLRITAGIIRPSSGELTIQGLNWKQHRKKCADGIGYMPDDFHFGDALTAQETIMFYASLRNVSKQRVKELLELVGLDAVRSKKLTAFSKGMRQRLLFAQALLAAPPLLILDEPTNGLDPYWMRSFVTLVQQCAQAGQAVIFSTHQLDVAEQAADEVIFLDTGHVRYQGAVLPLKEKYRYSGGLYGAFSDLVMQPS
ncbi:ABC transporter ATP-binding protein [Paenibacillus lemnae]|uniref:ABC transporter ATP-binding protein n=1 Tax=Paenibacillus lemnae TaxID=1330551 RepID=A0A848M3S5_PAELE|nr:ABC transporter ATP-binding protein [Paenibacillus lemnae]NMO94483.1 ABC transporter ATP-binding protein [Paenibacillus lemnae]